jgi:8-oxo-dGTP pyrophosphatase MutT (NUDIX family)
LTAGSRFYNQAVEGEPRDAASVVLLRDAAAGGLEVFMLRRGGSSTVMNDAYVFPGGKVDPEDAAAERLAELHLAGQAAQLLGEPDLDANLAAALFVAACRETFEETGVQVYASDLIPLSRWITPKVPAMMRRRFDTRFFLACLPIDADATHDGQEADASAWYSPREALERYRDGEIMLAPPQIMTLAGLVSTPNFAQLREHLRDHTPRLIEPVSVQVGDQRIIVYPGDERHPVRQRAMPGPTALVFRNDRFEPEIGFEQFFAD